MVLCDRSKKDTYSVNTYVNIII